MPLAGGEEIGGYRILRLIGSGGMGEVYLAQHPRLPRRDAMKVLRSDISADPDYRGRFEREADLASTLWHPNIVGFHDRGEASGQLWITMDFIDGHNAAELMQSRYPAGMPSELVVKIVAAVGSALDYAHKRGLLHRDIKPANIMLTTPDEDGEQRILLADFGIARDINDISGLTTTNMTVGTVAYAAPEQLMGESLDGRADQYALAATAYHLLTGTQLYPHSNPAVVISKHLNSPPPTIADLRPDLAALDEPLAQALSKNSQERYARCADFARGLAGRDSAAGVHIFGDDVPTQSAAVGTREDRPSTVPKSLAARTGRWWIAGAALAVVTILLVVMAVSWPNKPANEPLSSAPPKPTTSPAAAADIGPITGRFSASFGPELQLSDSKVLNPEPATGTFEIRSLCRPDGCVAIATATDSPILAEQLVFDDVGGQWSSIGTVSSSLPSVSKGLVAGCEQGLSPDVWEVLLLRQREPGVLEGSYEVTNANNCNTSRTVSLTRTGEVELSDRRDLTELPARVPSVAEGFRGRYLYTYAGPTGASHDVEGYVRTDCLRSGDRCMSYFSEVASAEPFVFSDGRWTLHYDAPVLCGGPDGPRVRIDRNAVLELPQPSTNPIRVLSGQGQEQVTGSNACAGPPQTYTLRFERVGD